MTSLSTKIHIPILLLSLITLVLFSLASFYLSTSLIEDSIRKQATSTADIFSNSIRDDLLNGLDREVYRKCQSVLQNTLVSSVYVTGLDSRLICDDKKEVTGDFFTLDREVLFSPGESEVAGKVAMAFQSDLTKQLVLQVAIVLLITVLGLLFGYWLVSIYLVKRETAKFTKLALMLTESDILTLENCSQQFAGDQSLEMTELCKGVEKLSQNWRKYQNEVIRNERLNAVNESSRLLAHDIKSPLGAIKTVSQMIESKPEMSKKLLDKGLARIEKMIAEIVHNEESNSEEVQKQPVDIKVYMEKIESEISPLYSGSQINIRFSIKVDAGVKSVFIDKELVERALRNLIKNSIEALDRKQGTVSVETLKTDEEFSITIKDDGPGLPDEVLKSIGAKKLKTTKKEGTGLGIYQAKKTMDLHGGKLIVNSRVGEGTSIKLQFS